jgi:hypothetical protein
LASFTLNDPGTFPPTTNVSVYHRWTDTPFGPPVGTPVETETVASDGTVTFDALLPATSYLAYARVFGSDLYIGFITDGELTTGGGGTINLTSQGTVGGTPPTDALQIAGVDKNGLLAAITLGQSGSQAVESIQPKQLAAFAPPTSQFTNPAAGTITATQVLLWPRARGVGGRMDVEINNPSAGCAIELEIGSRDVVGGVNTDCWGYRLRKLPASAAAANGNATNVFSDLPIPGGSGMSYRLRALDTVTETFSPTVIFWTK